MGKLSNIFRIPELMQKLGITLLFLAIYRVGFSIPLPYIDQEKLNRSLGTTAPVSVSVVLFDRFFEFATVIVIFATALLLVPAAAPWMHGVAGVLVPAVVVLSAGMWLVIRLRDLWLRLFDRIVAGFSPQRAARWRAPRTAAGAGRSTGPARARPAPCCSPAAGAG